MSETTWTVVTTPQQRYYLAVMLCHPDIKWKTTDEMARLRSLRRALALNAPTIAHVEQLDSGSMVMGPSMRDRTTRNSFTVSDEHARLLTKALEQLTKTGAQVAVIDELVEQVLEKKTIAEDARTAPPLDPAKEDWERPLPPVLEPPTRFAFWFRDVLQACESFGAARRMWIEGLKTDEERKAEEAAAAAKLQPAEDQADA
jgi:hypothetical protein